jgi:hypothetical protein
MHRDSSSAVTKWRASVSLPKVVKTTSAERSMGEAKLGNGLGLSKRETGEDGEVVEDGGGTGTSSTDLHYPPPSSTTLHRPLTSEPVAP